MVMMPDWVSVPEIVSVLSTARMVPPLIEILEASVPVSASFIDPAVTVIAPESVFPYAIETGVIWATERLLTVESVSTSKPKVLSNEVLTLSTVIEFSRSLLLASLRVSPPLTSLPPPDKVRVFAPRLIAVPE